MRRQLEGGFELDDDRSRVDIDTVWRFLCEESYWARGRTRETTERLVREASLVIGCYQGERQAGFCRVVSDGAVFAFLADVFVLPEFRGNGLGVELVREAVENGPFANIRWILGTNDAQGLYEKFGFGPPSPVIMERPSPQSRE
jgi:ribosomal protein S18 acetylase RimI-like enzyme